MSGLTATVPEETTTPEVTTTTARLAIVSTKTGDRLIT